MRESEKLYTWKDLEEILKNPKGISLKKFENYQIELFYLWMRINKAIKIQTAYRELHFLDPKDRPDDYKEKLEKIDTSFYKKIAEIQGGLMKRNLRNYYIARDQVVPLKLVLELLDGVRALKYKTAMHQLNFINEFIDKIIVEAISNFSTCYQTIPSEYKNNFYSYLEYYYYDLVGRNMCGHLEDRYLEYDIKRFDPEGLVTIGIGNEN